MDENREVMYITAIPDVTNEKLCPKYLLPTNLISNDLVL